MSADPAVALPALLICQFTPGKLPFLVTIKQSLSGREKRFVAIGSVTQFTEKELKIITLSETGEL
jgi:hypothetical protein